MPVGTVRGRYVLDAPALKTLKDLEKQGIRTNAQMKALGKQMDAVGGKDDVARLRAYGKALDDVRTRGDRMQKAQAKNWVAMTRVMERESRKQHKILDGLLLKLDEVGAKKVSPVVDLDGITKAIGQVEILERRLAALGRRRATPRVGLGGGFGGGLGGGNDAPRRPVMSRPFGGGGGGGSPGGRGLRSVGFGPLNFGSRSGIALITAAIPAVQSLAGATTALAGSLSGAALGAGAVGLAGGGALALGIGSLVSVAKPAATAIGEARKATEKYSDVLADFGRNSDQARKAKRELDQAMDQAPRGTRSLLRDMKELSTFWRRETRPGQESWVGLLRSGVRSGRRIAPTAAAAGNRVARRVEVEGGRFGRFLSGPVGQRGINVGTGMFNENLGPARQTLEAGAETFVNLMQASRPFLRDTTRWIRDWVRGWRDSTSNITRTRDRIAEMVEHFKTWRRLGGAAFRLVRDLLSTGAPEGQSAVERLTAQLDRWDAWVRTNPERVRDFFRRTVNSTVELARALAQIVDLISRIGTLLGPALDRFSQLISLAGSAGLLTPGVGALAYGAFRGARGRGGGAAGGGGAGPAVIATGVGAGAAGGLRGAAFGPGSTYALARSFGRGRAASAVAGLGAGAIGAPSRIGGLASGAARGAGKAFLPVAALMGILDFAGTEGNVLRRGQGALSGATLGLVPRPESRAARSDRVGKAIDARMAGLSEGESLRSLRGDVRWLRSDVRTDRSRGFNKDELSRMRDAMEEEIQVRRSMIRDLRSQRADQARQIGGRRAAELQEGFERGARRGGREKAFTDTIGRSTAEFRKLGPHGARAFATAQLMWARTAARGNKRMLGDFRRFEDTVIERFGGMARQVAEINGRIYVGASREWNGIANAIAAAARRGVSETSAEFARLRSVAVGALRDMGYTRAEASAVFKGVRAGKITAAQAAEKTGAGQPRLQSQSNVARAHGLGGLGDGTGDGIGDGTGNATMGGRGGRGATGSPALMGANQGLAPYAQDAARYGLRVSSGLRPGAITNAGNRSHHASGSALDLAGSPRDMLRFARHAASAYGSRLEELIHTPMGFAIKNGQRVAPYAQADHYDHVHLADTQPGGLSGGGVGGAPGGGDIRLRGRRSRLGGVPGALSTAANQGIARGMEAAINARVGGAPGGAGVARGARYSGAQTGTLSAAEINQLLSAVGLPPVFASIARAESGWNTRARNPSGASGLFQIMMPLHAALVQRYGGNVFDPMTNARVAKHLYDQSGLSPWTASRGIWGDGWGESPSSRARFVGAFRDGGRFTTKKGRANLFVAGEGVKQEDVTVRPHQPKGKPAGAGGLAPGGGGLQVAVSVTMGHVTIRSQADIDAIAEKVGAKVGEQLTARLRGTTDEDLLD